MERGVGVLVKLFGVVDPVCGVAGEDKSFVLFWEAYMCGAGEAIVSMNMASFLISRVLN